MVEPEYTNAWALSPRQGIAVTAPLLMARPCCCAAERAEVAHDAVGIMNACTSPLATADSPTMMPALLMARALL